MAKSRNMKLYVRRVFISDQFDEDLMPRYLNFMKGIIDSSDLPLNVSREILQENRVVRVIKKQLVKRTLDTLKQLSEKEDQTDYNTFFDAFGRNLKLVNYPPSLHHHKSVFWLGKHSAPSIPSYCLSVLPLPSISF